MPRVPPHFKVRTSVANHAKMQAVYWDDRMLALWVRLGVMAIERYADRTGDKFLISTSELCAITGRKYPRHAIKTLEHLANISPTSFNLFENSVEIHLPNLSEKQGFKTKKGARREQEGVPSSTTNKYFLDRSNKYRREGENTRPQKPTPTHGKIAGVDYEIGFPE